MTYEVLMESLKTMIKDYKKVIDEIVFAWPEREFLKNEPETPQEILETLQGLLNCSKELNQVMEQSPSSIFVADSAGKTMRINKAFEYVAQMERKNLLGRNVNEIESDGIFKPSVCALALREKRRVAVLQQIGNVEDIVVTGVPVYNERGGLFRVTTNALRLNEVDSLTSFIKGTRRQLKDKPVEEERLISESEIMKAILHLIDLVKNADASILLTGETGVGKGVLARYIHNTSKRAKARMVEINCGAIPEPLLESELFGYESGAFTGADKRGKPGLIELSDGGTLFLDEISELPLTLQVKLLHFLQNKKIIRVGGTQEIAIDVHIIAASNKPLKELVEKDLFRSDLYYRLNVIPIDIPPLRERREDIVPLAEYFVKKYSEKNGKKAYLDEKTLRYLQNQMWYGNIRELENFIERLVVTEGAASFENIDLHKISGGEEGLMQGNDNKNCRLAEIEREMVIKAYEKYGSSYKVAKELGISQTAAYRKIKKYLGH